MNDAFSVIRALTIPWAPTEVTKHNMLHDCHLTRCSSMFQIGQIEQWLLISGANGLK